VVIIRIFRTFSRDIPTSSATVQALLYTSHNDDSHEEATMQVSIQSRSFTLTDALRDHVQKRLGFTFSRVRNRVQLVQVRLSDLNGPRGGIDKCCAIKVCMQGLPDVVVEDVQADMYHAIDRATDRSARTTMRRLALDSSKRRRHARQQLQRLSAGAVSSESM